MSAIPTIAFFNNKGGVGKTSLVYHIAWMLADLGRRCLAVDLDPQSNLTAAMLDESQLVDLWSDEGGEVNTIYGSVLPIIQGIGDYAAVKPLSLDHNLYLLPGDLRLARFEDQLSSEWPRALDGHQNAYRALTAFSRAMQDAALWSEASVLLVDVGPNLGALNRAALIACDYVVVPLAPDLFSLQGLTNLGPTLRQWRDGWRDRRARTPQGLSIPLPEGDMRPVGYVVLQHQVRLDRPVHAFGRWMERIPGVYADAILGEQSANLPVDGDANCIGTLKHFASLVPMAQEARKPIFKLKAADGAIGSHAEAARRAGETYRSIALEIIRRCPARP